MCSFSCLTVLVIDSSRHGASGGFCHTTKDGTLVPSFEREISLLTLVWVDRPVASPVMSVAQ